MSIIEQTIALAETVASQIELPSVVKIYLPEQNDIPGFKDEFALLFLQDGTVAPFYASLPGTLGDLWQVFPSGKQNPLDLGMDLLDLVYLYREEGLAPKALALGAFNALSQHLMKRAGLLPLAESPSMGAAKPRAGEQVGMVGYFCPLIDKLLEKGVEVLVLEQQPERVALRPGLTLTQNPADLTPCRIVLCTAATLVNDSIDDILVHCQNTESFSLIGPSGSGLPDCLFERGIDAVGGVYFPDQTELLSQLEKQTSWGSAGVKYQLTPENYPGVKALLSTRSAQGAGQICSNLNLTKPASF